MLYFEKLVSFLRSHGYAIRVTEHKGCSGDLYTFAFCERSHNVCFGFCTENDGDSYISLNGQIAADHADCFDKWSKCPLVLPFPKNNRHSLKLLELLKFLGSDEGYQNSDSYAYLDIENNPYKYE